MEEEFDRNEVLKQRNLYTYDKNDDVEEALAELAVRQTDGTLDLIKFTSSSSLAGVALTFVATRFSEEKTVLFIACFSFAVAAITAITVFNSITEFWHQTVVRRRINGDSSKLKYEDLSAYRGDGFTIRFNLHIAFFLGALGAIAFAAIKSIF